MSDWVDIYFVYTVQLDSEHSIQVRFLESCHDFDGDLEKLDDEISSLLMQERGNPSEYITERDTHSGEWMSIPRKMVTIIKAQCEISSKESKGER